ncbi:MAG: hypothetical protein BWY88_00359 [Synergistetes bacterium ADurb.Bin520]|nr:MAG: hypothetical protein BWY88_00359 [Synergistetes bacterium ADurb.Bin520]
MVGTPTTTLTSAAMRAWSVFSAGMKVGMMTWGNPSARGRMLHTVKPKAWKLGRTLRMVSPS